MTDRVALVTNVTDYAGAPAVAALIAQGCRVLGHAPSFAEPDRRAEAETATPGLTAAAAQTPEELVAEALARFGRLDILISNDTHPATRTRIEEAAAEDYRAALEALMVTPFRLASAATRVMKAQKAGRMVFITSALPLHPYAGFAIYASARAGAACLAQTLARELGPFGIPVNAIAPNFLYSETYYPKALWQDDPNYVKRLKELVPMQRLGRPEEIGALIGFLASGASDFVTGQIIPFTGGWP
ncbi:MAG: SDR family oxidoreductase [Rhodospirillaceae bacterium]